MCSSKRRLDRSRVDMSPWHVEHHQLPTVAAPAEDDQQMPTGKRHPTRTPQALAGPRSRCPENELGIRLQGHEHVEERQPTNRGGHRHGNPQNNLDGTAQQDGKSRSRGDPTKSRAPGRSSPPLPHRRCCGVDGQSNDRTVADVRHARHHDAGTSRDRKRALRTRMAVYQRGITMSHG